MATSGESRLLYYGWTQPRSSGMFGSTSTATYVALGVAIVNLTLFMPSLPGWVRLLQFLVSGAILVPLVVSSGGKSWWEIMLATKDRGKQKSAGENEYRSGSGTKIPSTLLPGIMAGSKVTEHRTSNNKTFALIRVGRFYTVVIRVFPQGSEWVDQARFDSWVASFGQLTTTIGQAPDVEAITAVLASVPESAQRLASQYERQVDPKAHKTAREILWQAAFEVRCAEVRNEGWVSITFDSDQGMRRRDTQEQSQEIARRLPRILDVIEYAGLPCRPMSKREVTAIARRSYSPADELDIETALLTDEPLGFDWSDAGPMAASDKRGYYLHDSGKSISHVMDKAPASAIDSRVLVDIGMARAELPRKRLTMVYRPHTPAESTKIVDQDYIDAQKAVTSRVGRTPEAAKLKVAATKKAREEQALGAGVTRFSTIVTITIPTDGDLAKAETLLGDLGIASRMTMKPATNQQAAAFAGSLGLGLNLPSHVSVSERLAA